MPNNTNKLGVLNLRTLLPIGAHPNRVALPSAMPLLGSTLVELLSCGKSIHNKSAKAKQEPTDFSRFQYIDPEIITKYDYKKECAEANRQISKDGTTDESPFFIFVKYGKWIPYQKINNDDCLINLLRAEKGSCSPMYMAAKFVNYFKPVVPTGPSVRIYFLGTNQTDSSGNIHAPLLEIYSFGAYLRDACLYGFSADTWFALTPNFW